MCDCACHLNKFNPCDQQGGCGTNHRDTNNGCVTCPILRPGKDARQPHQPPICDGDRTTLDRWLVEIANLHAILVNPEPPIIDNRQHERFGVAYFKGNMRHVFSRGLKPSDPVAALGGVAPINSRSRQPSVSGSRERPIPINASAFDLKQPARIPNPTGPVSDQIGHLSAATILEAWALDLRDQLYPDQHRPEPTVDQLALWLRNRLDNVCDHYRHIADFAAALRKLRGALRSAAGETEPQPELCIGVPCKQQRCNQLTLMRQPDGDVTCINPACNAVLRPDEYAEWVKTHAKNGALRDTPSQELPADATTC